MSDHERIAQIAHFFANNERFAQKTSERIPNPAGLLHKFLAHKTEKSCCKHSFRDRWVWVRSLGSVAESEPSQSRSMKMAPDQSEPSQSRSMKMAPDPSKHTIYVQ